MITQKENVLRAIRRDCPEWVPNGLEKMYSVIIDYGEKYYKNQRAKK